MKRYRRKFEESYDKEDLKDINRIWKKFNKQELDKDLEEWVIKQLEKGKNALSVLVMLGITNLKQDDLD
jgi:hypothetical protein